MHVRLLDARENADVSSCGGSGRVPREKGILERHSVIADSGFTQSSWVMTPFSKVKSSRGPNSPQKLLYNFRLSQIRVVYESYFARLKGRWAVLKKLPHGPELGGSLLKRVVTCATFCKSEASLFSPLGSERSALKTWSQQNQRALRHLLLV